MLDYHMRSHAPGEPTGPATAEGARMRGMKLTNSLQLPPTRESVGKTLQLSDMSTAIALQLAALLAMLGGTTDK